MAGNLLVNPDNPTSANWAGYNGPTCSTTTTPLGDGATTFFKVTATNNVATWHDAYHTLTSGQTYTYEFYATNGNTGFIGFDWSVLGVSDTTVEFNLSTGAILSDNVTPAGGVARCDATNQTGVWRIAVTMPYSGTATADGAPFVSRATGIAGASYGDTFLFCKPVLTQGSTPTLSLTINVATPTYNYLMNNGGLLLVDNNDKFLVYA